jgi:Trp operon repressor
MEYARRLGVIVSILFFAMSSSVHATEEKSYQVRLNEYITAINEASLQARYDDIYARAGTLYQGNNALLKEWYRASKEQIAANINAMKGLIVALVRVYANENVQFRNEIASGDFQQAFLSGQSSSPILTSFLATPKNTNFFLLVSNMRNLRDFWEYAYDPTKIEQSTVFTADQKADYAKFFTPPQLPEGSPQNGDLIALRVVSGEQVLYLRAAKTTDGFLLKADGVDPVDAASQFKVSVDFNMIGLQSAVANNMFLSIKNIIPEATWLPMRKRRVTRAIFDSNYFGPNADNSVKFTMPTPDTLKSMHVGEGKGFLKVDFANDLFVRAFNHESVDSEGKFEPFKEPDATSLQFVRITDLHKELSRLRTVQDVQPRVAGYSAIFDGLLIASIDDYVLTVKEVQRFVDSYRTSQNLWNFFTSKDGIGMVRLLIKKLRDNRSPKSDAAIRARQDAVISDLEISLSSGLSAVVSGARFADGRSVSGKTVVFKHGDGASHMLKVDQGKYMGSSEADIVDSDAHFMLEFDEDGNALIKSPTLEGRYLQAGRVTANVQNWRERAKLDIARASFVNDKPGAAERYALIEADSQQGVYILRNLESNGYLRVSEDGLLRSLETSGDTAVLTGIGTDQTEFTLVEVDSFIAQLSKLRSEQDIQVRLAGYVSLAGQIRTEQHVELLFKELQAMVDRARASRSIWSLWETNGIKIGMKNFLVSADGLKEFAGRDAYKALMAALDGGYVDSGEKSLSDMMGEEVIALKILGADDRYLSAQSTGSVKSAVGPENLLDTAAHFVLSRKSGQSVFTLKSELFQSGGILRAPDISVAGVLKDRYTELTKLRLDGTIDEENAAKFELVLSADGKSFKLKRAGREGHVVVDEDDFLRVFKIAENGESVVPVASGSATQFTYVVISPFYKKLRVLRTEGDDIARVAAYRQLIKDINTLGELKIYLLELKYFIDQPRLDNAQFQNFKAAQVTLEELFDEIEQRFVNSLTQLRADMSIPTVSGLRADATARLTEDVDDVFDRLSVPEKIHELHRVFSEIDSPQDGTVFLKLLELTLKQRIIMSKEDVSSLLTLMNGARKNAHTRTSTNFDGWQTLLESRVAFADIVAYMKGMEPAFKAGDLEKRHDFMSLARNLLDELKSSNEGLRTDAINLLETVAYTYLYQDRESLVTVVDAIKRYVASQGGAQSYSEKVAALRESFAELSGENIDTFMANARDLVAARVKATDNDLAVLRQLIDDALWHTVVVNQGAPPAGTKRYEAQLKDMLTALNEAIPYGELIQHLNAMLNQGKAFSEQDIVYFMDRGQLLTSQRATQRDMNVIDEAIKVLTRGSRFQVSSRRKELEQFVNTLTMYKSSLVRSTVKSFADSINELKESLASLDGQALERALNPEEVELFFDKLQVLVDNRVRGTKGQVDNLVAWLSSDVVQGSRLVFMMNGGAEQIMTMIQVLKSPLPIAEHFADLRKMLEENPQFTYVSLKQDFIEKATFLSSPESRQRAAEEKVELVPSLERLLVFALKNQFAGDRNNAYGEPAIQELIKRVKTPLNLVLGVGAKERIKNLDFGAQVAELERGIKEVIDSSTASVFKDIIREVVDNKINGKEEEIARLTEVINAAMWRNGIKGNPTIEAELKNQLEELDGDIEFSNYLNALNAIVSAGDFSDANKNLIVGHAQHLADGLISSTPTLRGLAVKVLKEIAFNAMYDRRNELLRLADVIESYVEPEKVAASYSQELEVLQAALGELSSATLSSFASSAEGLVKRRHEAESADYEKLSQILDDALWHRAVRQEVGQATASKLKALAQNLKEPVSYPDLINLLRARLENQSFAPGDITYFMEKAQALVDARGTVSDKSLVQEAIEVLTVASRYQVRSRRADLEKMVNLLKVHTESLKEDVFLTFGERIAASKNKLDELDRKALSKQLSRDEAEAFVTELEQLAKKRVEGTPSNIAAFKQWLEVSFKRSRLFFMLDGGVARLEGLLETLETPATYAEHYSYLVGLLRDFPRFTSTQMKDDFLEKAEMMASDQMKELALSEGFDYKIFEDVLVFALQNQLAGKDTEVTAIINALRADLASEAATDSSFADRLEALQGQLDVLNEAGIEPLLQEVEALVARRLYGNDQELSRLANLLEQAMWNAVMRRSASSSISIERLNKGKERLTRPVLFVDRLNHLSSLLNTQMSKPDEQNRFISHANKLVAAKEQARDEEQLDNAITVVKTASYNQLKNRSELASLIKALEAYKGSVGKQQELTFSEKIADMSERVNALTTGTIEKYLVDLTELVRARFEATDQEMKSLKKLLEASSWTNIIRDDSDRSKSVASLLAEFERIPSFKDRLNDLEVMLSEETDLSEVGQDSFIKKVERLSLLKSMASEAELDTLIKLIRVAMFNQVQSRVEELQPLLVSVERHLNEVRLTGGVSFGERVRRLADGLNRLTEDEAGEFKAKLEELFTTRVDAMDEEIAKFKELLKAAIWNNVFVALNRKGISTHIRDMQYWYEELDKPIDFAVWRNSLESMLASDQLTDAHQRRFMYKSQKLVDAIPRATKSQLEDARELLLRASYNQLSAYKRDLDTYVAKFKDAIALKSSAATESFSERIKALKDSLGSLISQEDVDGFVEQLALLVDQRVDAIGSDLEDLNKWLMSGDVQNNEAIYFSQGSERITKHAQRLLEPVSYFARVQNLQTIVQNNKEFSPAQKEEIVAKIDKLIEERGAGITEGVDLRDVVKILQFVVDRRLSQTHDATMITQVKRAIDTLSSGQPIERRARYGERIELARKMLSELDEDGVKRFVDHIRQLVMQHVDGTVEQVEWLGQWLLSKEVQSHPVLFFHQARKDLAKMAGELGEAPAYSKRYLNMRQLLEEYEIFDTQEIVNEFMAKARTLTEERGRAAEEQFELRHVKELFVFALKNRLENDYDSSEKIKAYLELLDRPAGEQLDLGVNETYAQKIARAKDLFETISSSNFDQFIALVSQLVKDRVDSNDEEIGQLRDWLMSDEVQNHEVVFFGGGASQLQPLIDKFGEPVSFVRRVQNVTTMIRNTTTFDSQDKLSFFRKLDKLVAERWRAAKENFDVEQLIRLLEFAKVNRFAGDINQDSRDLIDSKIVELRSAAEEAIGVEGFVAYQTRINEAREAFMKIGSRRADVEGIKRLIKLYEALLEDRVDGTEDERSSVVTFIRERVLFHPLVYGDATFEDQLEEIMDNLMAPISVKELVDNFKKLLAVRVFSAAHKDDFIKKLTRIVERRGQAEKDGVDLEQLKKDIVFAQINRFKADGMDDQRKQELGERNEYIKGIEDLLAQLETSAEMTLGKAIAQQKAYVASLTPENMAAMALDKKQEWLGRLRILVNNIDQSSSQEEITDIEELLKMSRARIFTGVDELKNKANEYLDWLSSFKQPAAA